ncbi:Aste57867_16639 [Aphanomyces stellatus]|uniref:Aste57867_16639 protein n=1 Tax=Aphanomyces stellatus TaxID=120398 RepID=A0A485L6A2_9STRA|nr:hypothetical protein As57867_016582 [Aphanomyces stellatus]VFT93410.1 Aste57867_16639 [Aphanomyces stellatus]
MTKPESVVRKKLFRATAGLSLHEQSEVATALVSSGNNVLETIEKMTKSSKSQKKATKQSTQKARFDWLREHSHLRKLEERDSRGQGATKELESALLKHLNEASNPTTQGDTPEDSSDDAIVHEAVDGIQANRLGWIQQVNADRDTRHSMRQLLAKVKSDKETKGAAWIAHVKPELQSFMIDAIVGHHLVWEQLAADANATSEKLVQAGAVLWASLKESHNARHEGDLGTREVDLSALVDSLGGSACPNHSLKMDFLGQFQTLQRELDHDLQQLDAAFQSAHGVDPAKPSTGGWRDDDHDRYLKVFKDCDPRGIRNDAFIMRVVAAMKDLKTDAEIRAHDTWFRGLRRWTQQKQERMAEHARKHGELVGTAKAALSVAIEANVKSKAREEEMAQRLADQAFMHAKVTRFKGKRDAQAEMAAHQTEIARLEAEAMQQAAERKRQKEHELKKKLLQEHKGWQHMTKIAQDEAEAAQRAIEAEEQRQRDVANAERVAIRSEEYEIKCEEQRRRVAKKAADEVERLRVLDAIKQKTPYAERLAQIETDPERTRQATAAFTSNVEAAQEGLGIHETGLFPSHGYDTEKLFKDARFKLGIALRDAGLASTDYARKAMSTISVRNAGSYRHVPQAPTQLW